LKKANAPAPRALATTLRSIQIDVELEPAKRATGRADGRRRRRLKATHRETIRRHRHVKAELKSSANTGTSASRIERLYAGPQFNSMMNMWSPFNCLRLRLVENASLIYSGERDGLVIGHRPGFHGVMHVIRPRRNNGSN